jgi:sporulation protein YlmC with PRC-barrel domain
MSILKPRRALAVTVLLGLSALVAAAQEPAPPPSPLPSETPPADPGPGPSPYKRRAAPPSETPAGHAMLGLSVFSSDGSRIGDVSAVNTDPSGNVTALRVRIGGFLGFGARIVAIPEGRFAHSGQEVRLTFTADEVARLPEATR